jgi:hypothetical protein
VILAIEELTYRFPSSLICFTLSLALVGVHVPLSSGVSWLGSAARRAAVGEAGFIGL